VPGVQDVRQILDVKIGGETYTEHVTDAISCSIPASRWTQQKEDEIVAALRLAVERAVIQAPLRS